MNSTSQQQVWNKIADSWSKYREKPLDFVINFLKNKKGKILDIGCGTGRHISKIKNLQFYGVDFSEEMLKLAEEKSKKESINALFFKSNLDELPFSNSFFDSAMYISTLHCLTTREAREKSLEELKRVLKPNKEALISVWNKQQKRFRNKSSKQFVSWTLKNNKVKRYYYLYEKDELIKLLKKVGFKIISVSEDRNINVIVKK